MMKRPSIIPNTPFSFTPAGSPGPGRRVSFIAFWSLAGVLASADSFSFSTGLPDGRMATASRPDGPFGAEIESADDFVLTGHTILTGASFTGLLTRGATLVDVGTVAVEIYRVFPLDSVSPPDGRVPTRANSPSDVAFASRDTITSSLSFSASELSGSFTANNSVVLGINPSPGQTTGGEGPVTGTEVKFDVTFTTPIELEPDHYFIVPQVEVLDADGGFEWLSAPNPIVPPGDSFSSDLQSWIRNPGIDPDWLRVGTDIVGGATPPKFNETFSLTGEVPEPGTWGAAAFLGVAATIFGVRVKRGRMARG